MDKFGNEDSEFYKEILEKIKFLNLATKRKTRKDMPTRNSMKNNYNRSAQTASPAYKKRCPPNGTESEGDCDPNEAEYDEDDEDDMHDQGSYENPGDIIENDLENSSIPDTAPTAQTFDEGETTYPGESHEDLTKLDLKDLIYKLFLNIYNSEKESTTRLKNEIFPKINENTKLDDFITFAISNCMDHVKDELQLFIKKNLKVSKVKSEGSQKSAAKNKSKNIEAEETLKINDSSFVPLDENMTKYNEIIDKIIDFYELFRCSIDHIVEVWKEKLGHIERLFDIFDFRHKKLFSVNIWQDREIVAVIKLFLSQNYKDEEYRKRIDELKNIDEELSDNMQYNTKDVATKKATSNNTNKKNKKNNKKNKNKQKKKKTKDSNKREKEQEKLYEINDIDLLCSMIENPDTHSSTKGKSVQGRK